jgi:hypothetical protein
MPPDSGGIQGREPRAKLLVSGSFAHALVVDGAEHGAGFSL